MAFTPFNVGAASHRRFRDLCSGVRRAFSLSSHLSCRQSRYWEGHK
jgi:hypothetical protein